jgi:thioredoxin
MIISELGRLETIMDSNLIVVSDHDFDEKVLGANKPVLVDFWAEWCGPCRMVGPVVERIAGERDKEIVVAKLNIDESPLVAQRYGIMSIPTLVIFNAGVPVEGTVGAVPYAPLNNWIGNLLERFESEIAD